MMADIETAPNQALDVPFVFITPPRPVVAEMRPSWRIPVLLLLIGRCHGRRASWHQLHLLNWAVRTEATRRQLAELASGTRPDPLVVRFDPALPAAVTLSEAAGLTTWRNARLGQTTAGVDLVDAILDADALAVEREWLNSLPSISRGFAITVLNGGVP